MSGDNSRHPARFSGGADTDARLVIQFDRESLTAQVVGPLGNAAWCLALLEMAKFAVLKYSSQQASVTEQLVVPAAGKLPPL